MAELLDRHGWWEVATAALRPLHAAAGEHAGPMPAASCFGGLAIYSGPCPTSHGCAQADRSHSVDSPCPGPATRVVAVRCRAGDGRGAVAAGGACRYPTGSGWAQAHASFHACLAEAGGPTFVNPLMTAHYDR
jgi:hypothetical protein